MAKSKKSFSSIIEFANLMVAGLSAGADKVAERGLDEAFITSLSTQFQKVLAIDTEQEKLKADLKLKTAEIEENLEKLEELLAEAKKIVKMDFPQEQWVEFGIKDIR